jgi:hypothetical protein
MTIITTPPCAFSSDELDAAWEEWNCNCGPAALAACLVCTLDDVRRFCYPTGFETKGYLNPTMMGQAITNAGRRYHGVATSLLPRSGVVRVQWGGPWMKPEVPIRARYGHTHWIASRLLNKIQWVFDVNAGWQPFAEWQSQTVPRLTGAIKRADGTWSYTHLWEVRGSGS